jgi:MFS family permease
LHGICYSFFFVAGMIAVERLCQKDVRASAQGLLIFATNGLGMLFGSLFSGYIFDFFAKPGGGHGWAMIFLIPIAITVVAAIVFALAFNERKYQEDSHSIEAADSAGSARICAACGISGSDATGYCVNCGAAFGGAA